MKSSVYIEPTLVHTRKSGERDTSTPSLFLNKQGLYLLIGPPGSGKTTILGHLYKEAHEKYRFSGEVVILRARDLPREMSISQYIVELGIELNENLVLLLDGSDELDDCSYITDSILKLIKLLPSIGGFAGSVLSLFL